MVSLMVLLLAVMLAFADGSDRNVRILGRGKKVVGAASFLRMDLERHEIEAQSCAACEAVSQGIERQMSLDHHRRGAGEAMELLVNACEGIDGRTHVLELDAMPPSARHGRVFLRSAQEHSLEESELQQSGKVLMFHTFRPDELRLLEQRPDIKANMKSNVGLGEYCSALVEDFEDELVEAMLEAKPLEEAQVSPTNTLESAARQHYEVTEQVCVSMTKSCSAKTIEAIFASRAHDRESQGLDDGPTTAATSKGKGKGRGKGKAAKATKAKTPKAAPEPSERGWQPADALLWAQQAPVTAFASFAATSALVYMGGQVARVW